MSAPTTPEALAALITDHFASTPTEPLIIEGLREDLYRQYPAVNVSSLKPLAESARKYRWEQEHPKEATVDMIFGTCVHAALLEPERLPEMIVTRPKKWNDWRTDAAKEWRAQQTALVITEKELEAINACAESVKADPKAAWILSRAEKEVAVFRRHERTGLILKARLDLPFQDLENRTAVADIKKVVSVREHKMIRAVADRYYDVQGAFYCDIIGVTPDAQGKEHFYIISVEGREPNEVDIIDIGDWLEDGRALYEALLDRLVVCTKANHWPGISEDSALVRRLPRPKWVDREAEEITA